MVPRRRSIRGQACQPLLELAVNLTRQTSFDIHAAYDPDGSNTKELTTQKIRLGKK